MTEDGKKAVGRPRKYAGKRPTWTIRLEENFGVEIKRLAEQSGRSISEVCEQQIVASFRLETINRQMEARIAQLLEELQESRLSRRMLEQRVQTVAEISDEIQDRLNKAEEKNRDLERTVAGREGLIDALNKEVHRYSMSATPELEEVVFSAVKRALEEKNGNRS